MSLVAQLLQVTRAVLEPFDGTQELEVAAAWREKRGVLNAEEATIRGWAWQTPAIRYFRVAVLQAGTRSNVFSALALPHPTLHLPLFGAEVVEINQVVTVVAFDWMPLEPSPTFLTRLERLRRRHDGFPPGGDLPPWAQASFSPHALFSRPRGAVPDEAILAAYRDYLAGYLALGEAAEPATNPARRLEAQRVYCASHFENDPGGQMLGRIFGPEWAHDYAQAFLFRTNDL